MIRGGQCCRYSLALWIASHPVVGDSGRLAITGPYHRTLSPEVEKAGFIVSVFTMMRNRELRSMLLVLLEWAADNHDTTKATNNARS